MYNTNNLEKMFNNNNVEKSAIPIMKKKMCNTSNEKNVQNQ